MSDVAVRVEGLGKKYRLGVPKDRYGTLRDRLSKLASAPWRALHGCAERFEQEPPFWALKDVSFVVAPGEVVGIIGRNGAGKSTALKILSRITEPTEGEIDIKGRVGSLLEVGTGFHPELTGRENVYLNGAILGMRRSEIARKFDEIVAFAELEQFIDTPVKRYSSGMYTRLAFAVAAHLDPEILIVDEVLAVGDAQFQQRCLGKMSEIARAGRTILFVSHNMAAVAALCTRCCVLKEGRLILSGNSTTAIAAYVSEAHATAAGSLCSRTDRGGTGAARLTSIRFEGEDARNKGFFLCGDECHIHLQSESSASLSNIRILLGIYDDSARPLTLLDSGVTNQNCRLVPGINEIRCVIPRLPLFPGTYWLNAAVMLGDDVLDHVINCSSIVVEAGDYFSTGKLPEFGPLLVEHSWLA